MDIWDRVRECVKLLGTRSSEAGSEDYLLTIGTFKLFVWYLLGLENAVIDDVVFEDQLLNFGKLHVYTYVHGQIMRNLTLSHRLSSCQLGQDIQQSS